MIALVTDQIDKQEFAAWLETHCRIRPAFELRDYFGEISLASILEAASKFQFDAGNTPAELIATLAEAEPSMPVVADLQELISPFSEGESIDPSKSVLIRDLKTFLALYRIAEDMGYEW